jgi:hypothetical protein
VVIDRISRREGVILSLGIASYMVFVYSNGVKLANETRKRGAKLFNAHIRIYTYEIMMFFMKS